MAVADARKWLRHPMIVEEKVDGANLGLSLSGGRLRAQSRGHFLDRRTGGQWKALWRWLAEREEELGRLLTPSMIAFGEWCAVEHSTFYDSLPDWFLLFDVYDRSVGRFWSRVRRDEWARAAGLWTVPLIATGVFDLPALRSFLAGSRLGGVAAEGIYLRWDDENRLVARAKLVRPGWSMAGDDHWTPGQSKPNRLRDVARGEEAL